MTTLEYQQEKKFATGNGKGVHPELALYRKIEPAEENRPIFFTGQIT